jgi:Ca2+-binding EF-hand superfamily protein
LNNQEDIWPEWIADENKLAEVQTMLLSMQQTLEKNLGISPVDAFSIYDLSDTGFCSEQEFKRAFECFFGELLKSKQVNLPPQVELTLMLRLAERNDADKINYHAFCKFLEKPFV